MSNAVKASSWLPGARLAGTTTDGPDVTVDAIVSSVGGAVAVKDGDIVTILAGVIQPIGAGALGDVPVYGVAMNAGNPGDHVTVAVACPENVFILRDTVGQPSSAFVPGVKYDLDGSMTVNSNVKTNHHVVCIELEAGDDTADIVVPGRALFQIIRSQYSFDPGK